MKRKVFFLLSSLGPGGSEKVFWLLAQGFNKHLYDVSIVILDSTRTFLPISIPDVRIIDLKTIRASNSFYQLYKLIKNEKPYAVFSTAMHLNLLMAGVSVLVKVPKLIARESNIYAERAKQGGIKIKFWGQFVNRLYRRFDMVVCQSKEMKQAFQSNFSIAKNKLSIIPNPVLIPRALGASKKTYSTKRLLILARLSSVKSHDRLLKVMAMLPDNYHLTIAGDGECKAEIVNQINLLGIQDRVNMLGQVSKVNETIIKHDLMVLSSLTEGFPNVVLESLINGIPVVSFRVGGIETLIDPGFNGYIVEQNDLAGFRDSIIEASNKVWDYRSIKADVELKFSLNVIADAYTSLIN